MLSRNGGATNLGFEYSETIAPQNISFTIPTQQLQQGTTRHYIEAGPYNNQTVISKIFNDTSPGEDHQDSLTDTNIGRGERNGSLSSSSNYLDHSTTDNSSVFTISKLSTPQTTNSPESNFQYGCDSNNNTPLPIKIHHYIQEKLTIWMECVKIGDIAKYLLTYPLIVLSLWSLLYIFWGHLALPGETLFALIVLEASAIFLGQVFSLFSLPPLTGMLCAGLILRNVAPIDVAKDLSLALASPIRGISVVILLTRGAFSVNPNNISKYIDVVPMLAVGSCLIEATFASLAVFFIMGLPPSWAALVGCIMSAMSGSAVMPYLNRIEAAISRTDSIASNKSRNTLLIAKTACGLDAILAICLAKFAVGFILGGEELKQGLAKGFLEVVLGGGFGLFWGVFAGFLLYQPDSNPDLKTVTVFCGGIMSLIGLVKVGFPRGGPLGVWLGTLIAVNIWRWKKADITNLTSSYDKLWYIFEPLLFGVIGGRTDFEDVDWTLIYKGLLCLGVSMTGRIIGSFLMTRWSQLELRDRIFLVVAWCGKGTVQAALGPVVLDTVIDLGIVDKMVLADDVMHISVMIILVSSVVGFLLLRITGERIVVRK